MSAVDLPALPLPAFRGLAWAREGLRLWRRAPLRLWLLCVAVLLVEGALQLIPSVGVALSKLAVPMLTLGILHGLDESADAGRMRWGCLFDALRGGRAGSALLLAALTGLPVFAVQQVSACLVYGPVALDAVLFGHFTAHPELATTPFLFVLMLPGIVPATLLMLAPLLWWDGRTPWQAVRGSLHLVRRHFAAFAVIAALSAAICALLFGLRWGAVLVLAYVPWMLATTCAAWRELRGLHADAF